MSPLNAGKDVMVTRSLPFPPCYTFQLIFTESAPRPIQSSSCNVHKKDGGMKPLCITSEQWKLVEPPIKSVQVIKLRCFFTMNNKHLKLCVYVQNDHMLVRSKNWNNGICFKYKKNNCKCTAMQWILL